MLGLFTLAIFLSATLLFLVQPLIGKSVLPGLGGSPAVWGSCMVFFQAMLLAGYAYAHACSRLGSRAQVAVHALVLGGAAFTLPLGLRWDPFGGEGPPTLRLLGSLAVSVGPLFFAVSATAPLLQRWFSRTDHRHAGDPYFLYGASNAGSMLGLLAFPFVLEPLVGLDDQKLWWSAGYGLLGACILACGVAAVRRGSASLASASDGPAALSPLSWARRGRWVLLSAVPSSLLVGVTTHVTSEVATLPLLWVLPLALYLLTFILAFARRPIGSEALLGRLAAIGAVLVAVVLLSGATTPAPVIVSIHVLAFFLAAWSCHRVLAGLRPPTDRLTEFYLWMSVGGVAGGAFSALAAPVLFDSIAEYPLALAAAMFLRPQMSGEEGSGRWVRALVVGAGVAAGLVAIELLRPRFTFARESWQSVAVTAALPAMLALLPLLRDWARSFAAAALALLAGSTLVSFGDIVIHQERTFFGVHRVTRGADGSWHTLMHGNTTHGFQFLSEEHRSIPTSYYHPDGPAADAFYDLIDRDRLHRVALVGLGTGSMAAYSRPGMLMRFYEIDGAVIRLASDPAVFSYLSDSKAKVEAVLADGRIGLARSGETYDAIVLDAFSADAIPVHLITLEAFRDAYLPRLAEGGLISIHISNRYFDLSGHLARVAAELGLVARICRDNEIDEETRRAGKFASTWVVFARGEGDLGKMLTSPAWDALKPKDGDPLWTDQRSSLLGAIKPGVLGG